MAKKIIVLKLAQRCFYAGFFAFFDFFGAGLRLTNHKDEEV